MPPLCYAAPGTFVKEIFSIYPSLAVCGPPTPPLGRLRELLDGLFRLGPALSVSLDRPLIWLKLPPGAPPPTPGLFCWPAVAEKIRVDVRQAAATRN